MNWKILENFPIFLKCRDIRGQSTTRITKIGHECVAVSYTHLDVYKRQAYIRVISSNHTITDKRAIAWRIVLFNTLR